MPGDPTPGDARVLAARAGDLTIASIYAVNGKEVGDPAYEVKLAWFDALHDWASGAIGRRGAAVLAGDFNVTPDDRDVYDPDAWRGRNLASEPERERLRTLVAGRIHRPRPPAMRARATRRTRSGTTAWARSIADGACASISPSARPSSPDRLASVTVDRDERKPTSGEGKPSDHAPLIVTLPTERRTRLQRKGPRARAGSRYLRATNRKPWARDRNPPPLGSSVRTGKGVDRRARDREGGAHDAVRIGGAAAAVVALALLAAACGGGGEAGSRRETAPHRTMPTPASGGTLRVALVSDVQEAFDPQKEYYGVAWEYFRCCLLRTLLSYNGSTTEEQGAELFPDLAAEMPEISEDGLTWTFTLQSGLRYAPPLDDVEIAAADFVRAMERTADPRANVGGYSFYYSAIEGFDSFAAAEADSISGMEAVDDHTLAITLAEPTGDLGYRIAMPAAAPIPPNPSDPKARLGVAEGHDPNYGRFMVATGPYMFEGIGGARLLGAGRRPGAGGRIPARPLDRARTEPVVGRGDRPAAPRLSRPHRDLDRRYVRRPRAPGRVR